MECGGKNRSVHPVADGAASPAPIEADSHGSTPDLPVAACLPPRPQNGDSAPRKDATNAGETRAGGWHRDRAARWSHWRIPDRNRRFPTETAEPVFARIPSCTNGAGASSGAPVQPTQLPPCSWRKGATALTKPPGLVSQPSSVRRNGNRLATTTTRAVTITPSWVSFAVGRAAPGLLFRAAVFLLEASLPRNPARFGWATLLGLAHSL